MHSVLQEMLREGVENAKSCFTIFEIDPRQHYGSGRCDPAGGSKIVQSTPLWRTRPQLWSVQGIWQSLIPNVLKHTLFECSKSKWRYLQCRVVSLLFTVLFCSRRLVVVGIKKLHSSIEIRFTLSKRLNLKSIFPRKVYLVSFNEQTAVLSFVSPPVVRVLSWHKPSP